MTHENLLFASAEWKGVALQSRRARIAQGKRFIVACVSNVTHRFTSWAKRSFSNGLPKGTPIKTEHFVQQQFPFGD
jgi:hypothetical protein